MELDFPKRPFRTHGGAAVPHRKNTWSTPSAEMPPPPWVVLPMQQHIGAPCVPTVKKGDQVFVGTVVGDSEAYVSAPVHASVSGTVEDITEIMLPGGQMTKAVVIRSDGNMEPDPGIHPPAAVTKKEELAQAARAAGLVGLGGAGFPAHVKLNTPEGTNIDPLLVNAAECEPYVTSDHREALENGKNVLEGIYKVKEILGVERVIIAVEDNKPDVIQKLKEIADNKERDPKDQVRVLALKSRYPQGAEKVLVQACTGRKVPEGKLPADVGCLVMNIGSVSFLASYLRTGMPLTKKRVKKLRGKEIFLIPQGVTYLDPLMKVGAQLSKGKKDPDTKQRCKTALERYGLGVETEEMYPFELSGGMARRVLIASAVTEKPRLIIADEPTPGLDARAAKRILSHFRELADEGAGMLFITHDLEQALSVADEVVVFYAGETIEKAKAEDFGDAANLRHPYTRALWYAMPEHGFRASEGTQPYAGNVRKGCPYTGQCPVCTEECRTKDQIPLMKYRDGEVRCLYPDEIKKSGAEL